MVGKEVKRDLNARFKQYWRAEKDFSKNHKIL